MTDRSIGSALDLSNEGLCFGCHASPPDDMAFGMDLIGALRRHNRSVAGRKKTAGRNQPQQGQQAQQQQQQQQQHFPHQGLNRGWHQERRRMIAQIFYLLRQRKPNPPLKSKILLQMAKRLEVSLYRSAKSFAEYNDANTLKKRLQQHAVNIGMKAKKMQQQQQQQQQAILQAILQQQNLQTHQAEATQPAASQKQFARQTSQRPQQQQQQQQTQQTSQAMMPPQSQPVRPPAQTVPASQPRDETTRGRAIRHLRVGSVFFGYFRSWNRRRDDVGVSLQHVLTRCISNLPDLRTLDLYEDVDRGSISFQIQEVLPLLESMSHVRDLRLEGLDVFHRDDIRRLAGCFAANSKNNNDGRWRNLKSLVIHNIWILHHSNGNMADRVVNVDPIFSAMGTTGIEDEEAGGRRNLPNLETFRLVQSWPPNERAGDEVVDMPFQVSDSGAFARFLENGTSLKHLELTGFLFDPEHYRLMVDRLSGHRNIETLRLSALDLFDGKRETGVWRTSRIGSVPSRGEEEDRVREAARLLARLAAATPALRMIHVGYPFRTSLDRLLLPSVREIEARTAMNRNGLERIRCRGANAGGRPSPSRYGEKRERVEFLVRLRDLGGDEFVRSRFSNSGAIVDLVSLDALFLSLSMLPDVCIASESTV